MEKFLGLPIARKRLTDAEHIEKVRKRLEQSRRGRKWFALMWGVSLVVVACMAFHLIFQVLFGRVGQMAGNQVGPGFVFGAVIGLLLGAAVWRIVEPLMLAVSAIQEDRTRALLVKYYDMLVALKQTLDGQAPAFEPEGRADEGESKRIDVC
jgi:tetrahydromethanopterin S-methyltransferase subunit G